MYFLVVRKAQADKEIALIKCCFLIIGNKSFLDDPNILKEEDSKDEGDRYYFLEWMIFIIFVFVLFSLEFRDIFIYSYKKVSY